MNDVVEGAVQPQSGYVVAGLSGQLSLQTAAVARHALVELLSNASCVVADLSGLRLRKFRERSCLFRRGAAGWRMATCQACPVRSWSQDARAAAVVGGLPKRCR